MAIGLGDAPRGGLKPAQVGQRLALRHIFTDERGDAHRGAGSEGDRARGVRVAEVDDPVRLVRHRLVGLEGAGGQLGVPRLVGGVEEFLAGACRLRRRNGARLGCRLLRRLGLHLCRLRLHLGRFGHSIRRLGLLTLKERTHILTVPRTPPEQTDARRDPARQFGPPARKVPPIGIEPTTPALGEPCSIH